MTIPNPLTASDSYEPLLAPTDPYRPLLTPCLPTSLGLSFIRGSIARGSRGGKYDGVDWGSVGGQQG
eukprot:767495-Prorocentrum_minimum.AAC.1